MLSVPRYRYDQYSTIWLSWVSWSVPTSPRATTRTSLRYARKLHKLNLFSSIRSLAFAKIVHQSLLRVVKAFCFLSCPNCLCFHVCRSPVPDAPLAPTIASGDAFFVARPPIAEFTGAVRTRLKTKFRDWCVCLVALYWPHGRILKNQKGIKLFMSLYQSDKNSARKVDGAEEFPFCHHVLWKYASNLNAYWSKMR